MIYYTINLKFIFNTLKIGHGGTAMLRDEKNVYGFISKRTPTSDALACYNVGEYAEIYIWEMIKLREFIRKNPDKTFLISKIGGGLANAFGIFEEIINKNIWKDLGGFDNVVFLFEPEESINTHF